MYLYSILAILVMFSGVYFLVSWKPFEAILWLMVCFALCALLAFLINLPFFAATLIILYVSAVTVLFIYVVLMVPTFPTKPIFNPLLFFSILLFLSFIGLVTASYYCSFSLYSVFYYKTFFIENSFITLQSYMLNQLQLLGIFLYSKAAWGIIGLTFIFFVSILGLLILL